MTTIREGDWIEVEMLNRQDGSNTWVPGTVYNTGQEATVRFTDGTCLVLGPSDSWRRCDQPVREPWTVIDGLSTLPATTFTPSGGMWLVRTHDGDFHLATYERDPGKFMVRLDGQTAEVVPERYCDPADLVGDRR